MVVNHIAVCNHSTLSKDEDIVFWVEAVRLQLQLHVAPLWDRPPPGMMFYRRAEDVPKEEAAIIGFVDDDGNAESAGYHANIGGRIYGIVDVGQSKHPSVSLSHEALELYRNPNLDQWVVGPDPKRKYAVELNDPVQFQTYEINVTVLGQTRTILLSDFVLPRWFNMEPKNDADTRTAYITQNLLAYQLAPGGYQITHDSNGEVEFIFKGDTSLNRSEHARARRVRT